MNKFVLSAFADEIDMDLKKQMDVLESHGIRHIEMRGVNGKNLVEYSLEEVREIKRQLDIRGFKLSAIGSPIGKIGIKEDFTPHMRLFKHTLEIARIMGTNYIRMFSFFIPEGESHEAYRNEVMNRWRQFVEAAIGTDIILLHENEKGIYGDTPERCLDLLEAMDSDYVKATFDPANFVQCDVEVYPNAFNRLKKYVRYIHIKDALSEDHSVVPAGEGNGRIKEVLENLRGAGFEGFLSIEPHLGNFQGFADLEPNSGMKFREDGGANKFKIAVNALKKIMAEIGGQNE